MQQFKSLILRDRNLHLSILHYEPIHFDVFRILAEANGLKTIKLKTLLRGFLDREAIHYYGAEPQGSRIRKN
ncbi:hypothetical protein M378DRAFT_931554 [Amanita muscaria Koide BX008]|uniref:Structure-specific endonuclease subunit SLX4 n=1 Tax=Amanita muscaria (strain Koide BX008) TaxID=946122 RepID=A0A0C2SXA2_AMAMK|nr:hypothetical protein M378DRAFT_931554 [Amanita muscaria Koide BX008]